jgi:hypothetical protein
MKKNEPKPKKEEVVMSGMNIRMINKKPVLCSGEKIVAEVESFTMDENHQIASLKFRDPERFALEEAFTYDGSENYARDAMKGVLAVSFLLDSLSNNGNEDVDARTAQGLGFALRDIAKRADKLLTESFRLKEAEYRLQEVRGKEAA